MKATLLAREHGCPSRALYAPLVPDQPSIGLKPS
jgi:hypothetical protein